MIHLIAGGQFPGSESVGGQPFGEGMGAKSAGRDRQECECGAGGEKGSVHGGKLPARARSVKNGRAFHSEWSLATAGRACVYSTVSNYQAFIYEYGAVMRRFMSAGAAGLVALILFAACDDETSTQPPGDDMLEGPFEFAPAAFDIEAAPDGSILVAENTTIHRITTDGVVEVAQVPAAEGSGVNGLDARGDDSFLATSAGLDLGVGAGMWHISNGEAEMVADIQAFETENDPDATEGPQWKDLACEAAAGFTAGPQTNPYHLTSLSNSTALVADAAGNTLLSAGLTGAIDWVAVFTPPVEDGDWMVMASLDETTDCYVQPVPTSVAVAPDGALYVGELTGVTAAELAGGVSSGHSRVWRIESGASQVVCPSDDCEEVLSGFTSVIDLEFGPEGDLYVVEYDTNGWFAATEVGNPGGGTIQRCDVGSGACEVVADDLALPGAITFDASGDLWVLENNIVDPVVRRVQLP